MSQTPTLTSFLTSINTLTLQKNSQQLRHHLPIEPPYTTPYLTIINELRQHFPKGSEEALERKIVGAVKVIEGEETRDGVAWTAFSRFLVLYFGFLRDVDVGDLGETYGLLSELLQ